MRYRPLFRVLPALALTYLLSKPEPLAAADVWVVRLSTQPTRFEGTSDTIVVRWRDQLVFKNITTTDLTVRALEASNGHQIPPGGESLVVPAGRTRSVFVVDGGGVFTEWAPRAPYVLVINRLDVPAGVLVESRCEPVGCGERMPCDVPGLLGIDVFGSFALPVVTSLRAANEAHYHLTSDLGTQDSQTNVGIYNGEPEGASATVEIRASCDDSVLETRHVSVPGKTIVYETGFRNIYDENPCGPGNPNAAEYGRYVVMRMDRAGFSFVASRAQAHPPRITVGSTTSR